MSFPRVRLTINRAEYKLLKPGLDFIACQLANAKLGLRTRHHPLARVDPQLADIYERKQYSEEGDQALMSIRAKLWELTSSRKIRANPMELSAAALALRLLPRLPNSTHDPIPGKALGAKLEKYRKRAKRAAISQLGAEEYAAAADCWRCFVQWVRYYLTYLHEPKRLSSCRRLTWADRRSSLADLIANTLSDFGYAPLSEPDMKRVVRLIKEELRRGRHPVTLMELLRTTDPADRQFLFHVVAKKCELTPLPGVRYPYDIAASMRAEKFKNRNLNRSDRPAHSSGPDEGEVGDENQPCPESSEQSRPPHFDLNEAIIRWLQEHVEAAQRNAVASVALTTTICGPPSHSAVPYLASHAELISRPETRSGGPCYPDQVRDVTDSLLRWLNASCTSKAEVVGALRVACSFASEDHESHAV